MNVSSATIHVLFLIATISSWVKFLFFWYYFNLQFIMKNMFKYSFAVRTVQSTFLKCIYFKIVRWCAIKKNGVPQFPVTVFLKHIFFRDNYCLIWNDSSLHSFSKWILLWMRLMTNQVATVIQGESEFFDFLWNFFLFLAFCRYQVAPFIKIKKRTVATTKARKLPLPII